MADDAPEHQPTLRLEPATSAHASLLLTFIKELAEFEELSDEVTATEDDLNTWLFGPDPVAHGVVAYVDDEPVGFAVFFFSFSTFVGKPGLYLEDLYVRRAWRRRGIGRAVLAHLARIAVEGGCGRMEWSVLDWNEGAIEVYRTIGAQPMDEWTVHRLTGPDLEELAAIAPAAPPSSST